MNRIPIPIRVPLVAAVTLLATPGFAPAPAMAAEIDFNRDIKPILSSTCFQCHGPDEHERKADLRLDLFEGATADLGGHVAILPGDAAKSELIARVLHTDPEERMPPPKSGPALSPDAVAKLKAWIAAGAEYAPHWSFVKPVRRALPKLPDPAWTARNPIDRFVLARLAEEGLTPAAQADPHTLMRRVSLDITGLPPQPEEVDAFVNAFETNPDAAYEQLVDSLLGHEAYGERWAAMWLDLARYADSMGYASDNLRTIWAYRDWVINAFNANMPYDQFTLEQLAGDLQPEPTAQQLVATAFHRNTMNNTEGGTDDEEFRVAAVKDRVSTTMNVWMGLTMRCAECHTHKYDPITHADYYRFYDFFNQSADADTNDDAPAIPVPWTEEAAQRTALEKDIAGLRAALENADTVKLDTEQRAWEAEFRGRTEWSPLEIGQARSIQGAVITVEKDGSLFVSGPSPKNDTYDLAVSSAVKSITAFRLEAIPDERLPAGGSGRSPEGRFILSRFAAQVDSSVSAPRGRFVRVELPGKDKLLQLAEVEVFRDNVNVARTGKASLSSTGFGGVASRANDGNTDGDYAKNSVAHAAKEDNPWFEIDLGKELPVDKIVVWNRTDGDTARRLEGYRVLLLDEKRTKVWEEKDQKAPAKSAEFALSGRRPVVFASATADFSEKGYPVAQASGAKANTAGGWSVSPKQMEPHEAVFVAKSPIALDADATLTVTLDHHFGHGGQYNLGRFRVSVTGDPAATKRATISPAMLRIIDTPMARRTPQEKKKLAAYFLDFAPSLKEKRAEIAALEKKRDAIKTPVVPVMQELPPERRRETRIQARGNFMDLGEKVTAAVPEAFHAFPAGAPRNRDGVARWLMHPDNPLTARVAVNRIWAQLFGIGLVETEEDFGAQGTYPSHPKLLDWLATEYVRVGWDTKAIVKTIVMSATYRQASQAPRARFEADPFNRLLARGPRFRLDAEQVRDQALALSGLLVEKSGGPSVYPPQPPGMWRAAFNGKDRKWTTSAGDDRYRRGLYTFWRRSVPYPSMATFDAPSREVCNLRRIRTNTPLQAFVTLNDPVYVEIAQAMARRIAAEGGETDDDRARFALKLVLVRPPTAEETATVVGLYRSELERYGNDAAAAKELATSEIGEAPKGADLAELAAWTSVANVVLNLDAALTKG